MKHFALLVPAIVVLTVPGMVAQDSVATLSPSDDVLM